MAHSSALVETLKRELRARNITYARVARHMKLSEATVKRLFSQQDFTLERIDHICALMGMEFSDLVRSVPAGSAAISQLTYEQESEFVANPRLMLVALLALNYWKFEEIVARYDLSQAECIKLLARLDRLKFIELLPNNRYRLLVSQAFSWIPDGPIQRFFKEHASRDFLDSRFDHEDEFFVLSNGALSRSAVLGLLNRLRQVASEFADMRANDSPIPAVDRIGITLFLAARRWEPGFLARFRRPREETVPLPNAVPGSQGRSNVAETRQQTRRGSR
jgi:transcriptional regulator with XRE-family HTH domain